MSRFDLFVDEVIKNEGGYVNDPRDAGGETKYGITKRSYPKEDIKNLTIARAKEIYRKNFWIPHLDDERILPQLAFKIFDLRVNTGSLAVKVVQYALLNHYDKKVKIDRVFGPKTAEALATVENQKEFYGLFIRLMTVEYERIANIGKNSAFLKGWLRRLEKVFPKW